MNLFLKEQLIKLIVFGTNVSLYYAAAAAKSHQSCPTVWPHRRQPTGFPVPGILQTRTLEWVAISFSNAWKWKVKVKSLSRVRPLATPWTAAHQAPLSMGFSRQEYWSGVPLPSPSSCGERAIRRVVTGYGKERQTNIDMSHSFLVIGSHWECSLTEEGATSRESEDTGRRG